jgi:hypothetical protein
MSRKKSEFQSVVSFRVSENEKQDLEKIIQLFNTTKSEFIRDWVQRLLTTINN